MTDNTQTLHNAELERLKKQLDIAMKALRHYADDKRWLPNELKVANYYYALRFMEHGYEVAQQAIEDVEKVK